MLSDDWLVLRDTASFGSLPDCCLSIVRYFDEYTLLAVPGYLPEYLGNILWGYPDIIPEYDQHIQVYELAGTRDYIPYLVYTFTTNPLTLLPLFLSVYPPPQSVGCIIVVATSPHLRIADAFLSVRAVRVLRRVLRS